MQLNVTTLDNKPAGQIELNDSIFAVSPLRKDIMSRVVNWQLSKRQAGTHKTKEIGDISGRKAKPWAQKGTGRARQGSLRSPQFRGGATIFGPVVRSHAYDLTKKFRALGLKMALSAKAAEGKLIVIADDNMKEAKTSAVSAFFEKLGVRSVLFIGGAELNQNFKRAAANVPNFDALPQVGINVYDILRRDVLVLTKDAVDHLNTRLASPAKKQKAAKTKTAKGA